MYTDIILIVIGTILSSLLAYITYTLKKWRQDFNHFIDKVEEHERVLYGGQHEWEKGLVDFVGPKTEDEKLDHGRPNDD